MVLAEKGKEQRKKGPEGSIATWPAREWGGRESHSERRGVIWSAEREPKWGRKEADLGMDFWKTQEGWREHLEGERIAAAWDRTRVREEIGHEQQESRGGEKETLRPRWNRELGEQRGKLNPGVASCLDTDDFFSYTEEDENFKSPVYKAFFYYLWQKMTFICKPCWAWGSGLIHWVVSDPLPLSYHKIEVREEETWGKKWLTLECHSVVAFFCFNEVFWPCCALSSGVVAPRF